MGAAIKCPVPDLVKSSFVFLTSGHSDACQDIKNTNDDLTRSGTGHFIAAPMWQQWASNFKGLTVKINRLQI